MALMKTLMSDMALLIRKRGGRNRFGEWTEQLSELIELYLVICTANSLKQNGQKFQYFE